MYLAPIVLDQDRNTYMECHNYLAFQQASILYSPSKEPDTDSLRIFKIFSLSIWIYIFISYSILFILNSIQHWGFMTRESLVLLLDYYRIFWMQGIMVKYHHWRFLLSIWLLSSFILIQYFTSDFRALLISDREDTIELIDDLMSPQIETVIISQNSYQHRIIIDV